MAKHTQKKAMTPFDKMLTAVIVLVILAVLALAVFATYGRISDNIEQAAIADETTAIENGERPATVRYMASQAGKSVEDYLAQYGLTLSGDLKATSEVNDMTDQMTLENYYKFSDENTGETTDVAAKLTEWGADELGITKDTTWSEVQEKLSISKYVGEDDFNTLIEQYKSMGYDTSTITADMSIKDANEAMEAMMKAGPVNSAAPAGDDGTAADTADDEAADAAEGEAAPAE